jgi:DNA polymerase III epsilon subunit-like protein
MKFKFNPYSKNIIFLDTEFSSLDPYKGEVLSIGLVKLSGEELYLELIYDGPLDDWVEENIIPTLKQKKLSRKEAIKKMKKFVGIKKPFMISYVNQYDAVYTYKLFGKGYEPFNWIPIDFASILFGMGVNPESYCPEDKRNFFKKIGVDTEKFKHSHHALDDAKLLREVYLKMVKK